MAIPGHAQAPEGVPWADFQQEIRERQQLEQSKAVTQKIPGIWGLPASQKTFPGVPGFILEDITPKIKPREDLGWETTPKSSPGGVRVENTPKIQPGGALGALFWKIPPKSNPGGV